MRTLWWVWGNRFNLDFERGPRWCYKGSEWGNLHRRLVLAHAPLHAFCNIDPDEPANILVFSSFDFCLKNVAPPNMSDMSCRLDTSHCVSKVAVERCCTEEHTTHIHSARARRPTSRSHRRTISHLKTTGSCLCHALHPTPQLVRVDCQNIHLLATAWGMRRPHFWALIGITARTPRWRGQAQ